MSNARPRLAEIEGRGASCELSVRMTAAGPVLQVRGASLSIRTPGALTLRAGTLAIEARGSAAITVGGALVEQVGGAAHREAAGNVAVAASAVAVAAEGAVTVRANDDVTIHGETIALAPEQRARVAHSRDS